MKKQMFRAVSLIMSALMLVGLCACSGDSTKPYESGKIDGDRYQSEFLGITFEKPSDWVFYSDEEIANVTGTAVSILNDKEFEKEVEASKIEFYAANAEGNCSVNLSLSKGNAFTDLNKSIDASLDTVKKQYGSLGWTVNIGEKSEVNLSKDTFVAYPVTVDAAGVNMIQYMYFAKVGKYIECIACTSISEQPRSFFENMFKS